LALLGGEPVWQVLHGLPFAIAGVACALCASNMSIAIVTKVSAAAPMNPLTTAGLIAFAYCMVFLQFDPDIWRTACPTRSDDNQMAAPGQQGVRQVQRKKSSGGIKGARSARR
jgi:hypothetical protein